MKPAIYTITREIAIFLSVISSYTLLKQGDIIRAILNLVLLCFFIFISKLHQKRIKVPGTSYCFIFIILFCVNSLAAGICNIAMMKSFNVNLTLGRWIEEDHYLLYFSVSVFTYLIIVLHLFSKKQNLTYKTIEIPDINNVYVNGSIILLLIYFVNGKRYEALIPIFIYFALSAIKNAQRRMLYCSILIALSFLFFRIIILSRFKLIEIVLPTIFCLMVLEKPEKKIGIIRSHIIFIFIVLAITVYGVISEIVKLNMGSSRYDAVSIFSSSSQLINWSYRQFYRVFIIWIKLGGYIIYHTNLHGKYYGLTYIKSLLGVFGFETVSLPKISAAYNSSTYAQPGLLAEGYANFGLLGAVINLLSVYFLISYLERIYYEKPSFERLLYMTVPFSQILLDGGTLNSALFFIIMCFILTNIKIKFRITTSCDYRHVSFH